MFHIIGTGACGFLRMHQILKNYIPIKYKGGGPKFQNSFQNPEDGEIGGFRKSHPKYCKSSPTAEETRASPKERR